MSGDWFGKLTAAERAEWDEFEQQAREDTVRAMADSAMVVSLAPQGEPDVKFALELGLSIMMGKPLVVLVMPGRTVPPKLRRVADAVIRADIDTAEGRAAAGRELLAVQKKLGI